MGNITNAGQNIGIVIISKEYLKTFYNFFTNNFYNRYLGKIVLSFLVLYIGISIVKQLHYNFNEFEKYYSILKLIFGIFFELIFSLILIIKLKKKRALLFYLVSLFLIFILGEIIRGFK